MKTEYENISGSRNNHVALSCCLNGWIPINMANLFNGKTHGNVSTIGWRNFIARRSSMNKPQTSHFILSVLMTLCLLLLTVSVNANAGNTVIKVPGDYATIQAAINAAVSGDTVLVSAGTYHESLIILKPLTIKSVDGAATTIIDGNSATENYYMVNIKADNVTLDGFTITNPIYSATADISGVLIGSDVATIDQRKTNIRVTNCIIKTLGVPDRNPVSFGSYGINVGPALEFAGFTGNAFSDNQRHATTD